jgi:hypothetical protein
MNFTKKNYVNLLKLIKKKYRFIHGYDWVNYKNGKKNIILRHDVDFDTTLAAKMAELEKKYEIKSNYFFLMRDDFYDLYSIKSIYDIKLISKLGHNVGLHINPQCYKNFLNPIKYLKRDINYFQNFYNIKVNSISYHQPSLQSFTKINLKIKFNSYDQKIMNCYKYFSDSSMKFDVLKFRAALLSNTNIQLLIHPIWWMTNGIFLKDKLKIVFKKKFNILKSSFMNYDKLLGIRNKYE